MVRPVYSIMNAYYDGTACIWQGGHKKGWAFFSFLFATLLLIERFYIFLDNCEVKILLEGLVSSGVLAPTVF
jgi:hypothetical protein